MSCHHLILWIPPSVHRRLEDVYVEGDQPGEGYRFDEDAARFRHHGLMLTQAGHDEASGTACPKPGLGGVSAVIASGGTAYSVLFNAAAARTGVTTKPDVYVPIGFRI